VIGDFALQENEFMAAMAGNLTLAEFETRYGKGDQAFEYWRGQAIPKGMPTWIHGIIQRIVMELLTEAGYIAGSEVELRIVSDARPKPDVIATKGDIENPYPTKAVDVVVEILSVDDSMTYVIEKCAMYREWGFPNIYIVDPASRLLFRWTGHALEITDFLMTASVAKLWERLDLVVRS
jgi:Uma2 family endonuclease